MNGKQENLKKVIAVLLGLGICFMLVMNVTARIHSNIPELDPKKIDPPSEHAQLPTEEDEDESVRGEKSFDYAKIVVDWEKDE